MKLKAILAVIAIATLSAAARAADDHTAKHGGIFVEGKAVDMEIVAKPQLVHVYVYDHGKPSKIEGAKGKLTLLNGSQKTETDLRVAGNKLEAKGDFKVETGTKGIASVTLPGKPAAVARFEVK